MFLSNSTNELFYIVAFYEAILFNRHIRWSCDIDIYMFYMVSLVQPFVGTGETLVLAHNYCITNVLYILI